LTNYGYRSKYEETLRQMRKDGMSEVISMIHSFLKDELSSYADMKLSDAMDKLDYSFAASIHDSVYCMPYHECIVILEYLTDYSEHIDSELQKPCIDGNSSTYEPIDDNDITYHLCEVMRNWIFNGITSILYYVTDSDKTVNENIAILEKDYKEELSN
jgi:hypothetical protein